MSINADNLDATLSLSHSICRVLESKVDIFIVADGRRDMRLLLDRRLFESD